MDSDDLCPECGEAMSSSEARSGLHACNPLDLISSLRARLARANGLLQEWVDRHGSDGKGPEDCACLACSSERYLEGRAP